MVIKCIPRLSYVNKGAEMSHLCKDKEQTKHDAEKVKACKAEGKEYFICKKCDRVSHKEDHLCKPKKA